MTTPKHVSEAQVVLNWTWSPEISGRVFLEADVRVIINVDYVGHDCDGNDWHIYAIEFDDRDHLNKRTVSVEITETEPLYLVIRGYLLGSDDFCTRVNEEIRSLVQEAA